MKKGFTLIELLAVIVILAIIAVIAVPIVLNIIDDSKKNSNLRSAEFYLDTLEMSIAQATLKNTNIKDDVYNIKDGNICLDESCTNILEVEVKGNVPKTGKLEIKNGEILDISFSIDNQKIGISQTGEIINYAKLEDVCKPVVEVTTGNLPKGNFEYGDEYICNLGDGIDRRFFVLENGNTSSLTNETGRGVDDGEVSLIMNQNINSDGSFPVSGVFKWDSSNAIYDRVEWVTKSDYLEVGTEAEWNLGCSDTSVCGNNTKGPLTALKFLSNATKKWSSLAKKQITLPTIQQIIQADEKNISDDWYYIMLSKIWLYDYLSNTTNSNQNVHGYWVSTPDSNFVSRAMLVHSMCCIRDYSFADLNLGDFSQHVYFGYGVRPVIILKI